MRLAPAIEGFLMLPARSMQQGALDWFRQSHRSEEILRIKIVFARLVHNAQKVVLLGAQVAEDTVNLSQFKRALIPVVFDADYKAEAMMILLHLFTQECVSCAILSCRCRVLRSCEARLFISYSRS